VRVLRPGGIAVIHIPVQSSPAATPSPHFSH
jgi:hypothetical protein